ncbi:hypothetical protein LCGC14_0642950 [marine sediment metagenome]|uniref:J domain-containing protein n=1 Tax=marine sediment metagenome TaxID=412755 RepID=A0A0F9QYP1_9ZZZZ|nr:hypothetical protein [Candidatus Aminicenantes bacterium]
MSINACLVELGATYKEAYSGTMCNFLGIPGCSQKPVGTIYNRMSKGEILGWAKVLYRESIIKYHPDKVHRNPDFRIFCDIKARQLNVALDRVKSLVEYNKGM